MELQPELQQAVELARERERQTAASNGAHKSEPISTALVRRRPLAREGPVRVRRALSWLRAHAELRGSVLLILGNPHEVISVSAGTGRRPRELRVRHTRGGSDLRLKLRSTDEAKAWARSLSRAATTPPSLADIDVLGAIGRGGGGEVYLARMRGQTNRELLALKVIRKEEAFRSRFALRHAMDERLALELARGCPFVVRLRHAFQDDHALYLATEFGAGGDLRGVLKRTPRGRLDDGDARQLLAQLTLAVQHVHALAIVFRDLKPENVLLSAQGDVRLCDFGLAKVLATGRHGRTRSFCGTTQYMSPQVIASRTSRASYGISTDVWSLGALFYRILVGYTPFDDTRTDVVFRENDAHSVYKRIQLDDLVVPRFVSSEAKEMLMGMLAKREEDRWNIADIMECAFFENINWEDVLERGRRNRFLADEHIDAAAAMQKFDTSDLGDMKISRVTSENVDWAVKGNRSSRVGAIWTSSKRIDDGIVGYGFSMVDDIPTVLSLETSEEEHEFEEEPSVASFASFASFAKRRTSEMVASLRRPRINDEF